METCLVDIRVYKPPDTTGYRPIGAGQDLHIRQPGSTRKREVLILVTVTTTVCVLLLLLGTTRRQLQALQTINDTINESYHYNQKNVELLAFHLSTISSATNGFSGQNIIGGGGFGIVYKGTLDGETVAVKRLSKYSTQGLEEFKSEIELVAKLQHMNLVRLLGYCAETHEKILVYEYMPNKSLDKFIFDPEGRRKLDWRKRFHVINGVAQGLLYLHQYSRLRVIHRDLKASNILLDDEWNPKISDFGLAKIFTWNGFQANTNRIVGTYGYMSPEYAIKGLFSVKSDVFSFGVLLLEILSGKKNTSSHHCGHSLSLLGYAWDLWKEGRALELMDPMLGDVGQDTVLKSRCVHVALLCVQESPEDRPTMLGVVSMLNNEGMVLRSPSQPAFSLEKNIQRPFSLNDVTISGLVGR